jgi:hypothetical protein
VILTKKKERKKKRSSILAGETNEAAITPPAWRNFLLETAQGL